MWSIFTGVFFHWLGGLSSGSFYVPYKFVRRWSWEVYWLAGGFMSWIIAPWFFAFLLTKGLIPSLQETWANNPEAIQWGYLFGCMWGIGGLTFGLTMRYLGMSLGMAIALGYCTVFGTLMPPLIQGDFYEKILSNDAGRINLFGLGICVLGIAITAIAGMSKEREMNEEAKKKSISEFNFKKGILIATFSGIFSAGMSYAMAASSPLADVCIAHGTQRLWSEIPRLCVILAGGFTVNFIWCLILILKNGTLYQFFTPYIKVSEKEAAAEPLSVTGPKNTVRVNMGWNYFFAMLAGLLWYGQFFFYSMGETFMGTFKFSSWTLHMASIIIFSSLWGLALKEWKGSSKFTMTILAFGIGTLIYSTLVVGYSNFMNYQNRHDDTFYVTPSIVVSEEDADNPITSYDYDLTHSKKVPKFDEKTDNPNDIFVKAKITVRSLTDVEWAKEQEKQNKLNPAQAPVPASSDSDQKSVEEPQVSEPAPAAPPADAVPLTDAPALSE